MAEETLEDAGLSDAAAFDVAMFYFGQSKQRRALHWIERVREVRLRERAKVFILYWRCRYQEAIEAGWKAIQADPGTGTSTEGPRP